ncbi:MAG: right-handed parallel beta-helix repeat-containing protein [Gemmatimonadaceae bacterium]|nr:right-handed parallel beta-helix repeat-containing protein [Gemmatimonadaceae bacterium]
MKLNADCTTDATIFIPNGFTLDGRNRTITAVDPVGGHFVGAVVQNAGAVANVKNLGVTTSNLANVCDVGPLRLRGIMLEGASGTIEKNTVTGINQGASGCQEGNAIEVRNAPFDGTHPNTMKVVVKDNTVDGYQKTGIVTNGDVRVTIEKNDVGASATQAHLAANGIQVGFGAIARVVDNDVAGNSWCCASAAATAILVFAATGVDVSHNDLSGNADVGIYFDEDSGGGAIRENEVYESGPDGFYDVGIGDYGVGNDNRENDVCGYVIPYEGNLGVDNEVCGEDDDEDDTDD